LFALLVTAILLLLSFTVLYFYSLQRKEVFHKRLQSRVDYNDQLLSIFGDSAKSVLDRVNSSSTTVLPQKSIGIFDLHGKPVYQYHSDGAEDIVITPEIISDAMVNGHKMFTIGRREAVAFYHHEPGKPVIIGIAAYDEDGWNRLRQLRQIFAFSLIAGILVVFVVGYIFSNQLLYPLTTMISEVDDISSQNLSTRIHTSKNQDELNRLASTFNNLLDRLQESFTTQRRFISNASHELSTPLTSISSQLQVTLHRERTPEEYRQVMQSVLEDVQQMLQLTKSLLEIAKAGSHGTIELNEVRIDELMFKVIPDVHRLNPDYKAELNFEQLPNDEKDMLVFGNSDLLYISFKNIIENGCKFSDDHTSLINIAFNAKEILIDVINKGEVIKETDQIFQPFYRSDSARNKPGFGLGLTLARHIVALHKGTIKVNSDDTLGTKFTVVLPTLTNFSNAKKYS
jgi:two-component system, OmpR family, sensor histidine kinase ArlS